MALNILSGVSMLKQFFPLFFLFFAACGGAPEFISDAGALFEAHTEDPFLLTLPGSSGLVFIGVAGRRSNPNETMQYALEDAARRAALFYGVSGECIINNEAGSGAFDYSYSNNSAVYYDEEGAIQYLEALEFDPDTDAMEMENALFIRASYRAALPGPVEYRPNYAGPGRKPDWVDQEPRIPGYEVGIGYAGRYSSIADACTASWKNAVFSIVRNISTSAKAGGLNYQGPGFFDYNTSDSKTIYAAAELENFYILDIWIDPQTKAVWTLGIAKSAS
jgi:hypothetical protein